MGAMLDCISAPPSSVLRANGFTAVSRYLSWDDSRDTYHKVIHQEEFDRLVNDGIDVLLNWEFDGKDWLGGQSRGVLHATEAARQAKALGYPAGCTIAGSADFDMTLDEWNTYGKGYAGGFSGVLHDNGYGAGVYGPWDVLSWCYDLGSFNVYWQCMSVAYSGWRNRNRWPAANLWQRYSILSGGIDGDYNDILTADFGQYRRKVATMFLAHDTADGRDRYFVCDGLVSREVSKDDVNTLIYLANSPYGAAIDLKHGTADNAEWEDGGWVRKGWVPAMGAVTTIVAGSLNVSGILTVG